MSELGFHQRLNPGNGQRPNAIIRYLSRFDDGKLVRAVFHGLLIGAICVLALDLRDMSRDYGILPAVFGSPADSGPLLPPAQPFDNGTSDPRDNVTVDKAGLDQPMHFALNGDGVLSATGKIIGGSAEAFAAEIKQRGEYVKTVSINSGGGSVDDAIAMARLIREKGYGTRVADGALCASSCPLLFAGGETREVGARAAIGLHQFYAAGGSPTDAAVALSNAQATTAKISRFLIEMQIDPQLWLHALDTPPQALYYLSPSELASYKLVTNPGPLAAKL